jgi:biopolymer transport protein ExbB
VAEGFLATWSSPLEALSDLVAQGGPFVIWIFLCGLLMWTLVVERAWYFSRILPEQTKEALAAWQARREHHTWCARQIRRAMISRVNTAMNANQLVLRTLVPMAPLLGLIGTVSGMLEVFDSMALRGSADARAMASGVSEAMICTLTGLAVSITGLYPNYYFHRRTRLETELLADRLVY